ncbi:MAG: 50S ribosomal protein L5 [Candidatus Verstraetearchaeota archaeon]|nr:50S ribosomal protein L5 [Candidatus Verstraetearchaeota archaeon]
MSEAQQVEEAVQENPMRQIKVAKVVVNMSVGSSGERLLKAMEVLRQLTGMKPCPRRAKRTIREFGIRKGENIACIVTLRGKKAVEFLKKAFEAIGYRLPRRVFDEHGNFSFGIAEHIQLPGTKYDPSLGIFGMDVCVTLERPGYRVMRRRRRRSKVGFSHRVTCEEAIEFISKTFGVKVEG